jgi:hypothetical protein
MMTQQARIENITLKEDYGNANITQDDDFGDMGFGMNTLLMNDDFFNELETILRKILMKILIMRIQMQFLMV